MTTNDSFDLGLLTLTQEQIDTYHEKGVLVVEAAVADVVCEQLKARMSQLLTEFEPSSKRSIFTTNEQTRHTDQYFMESANKVSYFFEENAFNDQGELAQPLSFSINKVGHGLHTQDRVFKAFSLSAKWRGILQQLGMAEPRAAQSMYIFKQPSIGGEVNCHQDSTFLYTRPMSVIGLWFALEDATLENGCLWGVPGGHREGLLKRFERVSENALETKMVTLKEHAWSPDELVALPVKKGSLVILNGEFPHLSYANRSDKSRHAYALHAIDNRCHYPAENWLQLGDGQQFAHFYSADESRVGV
ncbi:phytanoyl-CoA dioxygenase family protein [Marinomonas pollencensis]|uniref:Phytanoyl-CoA hydroxylase n=1 Tax=Marinomonas pollencensis TaxID=491954 RepID=A0A3E0DEM0_9GAMM|nr:phytanoyl-CoA dioxygenase family protein [Marinomonas pollencensis]REG81139.1 phytanoyl-CoA hydroxylase [Marinomonas pollencensis]